MNKQSNRFVCLIPPLTSAVWISAVWIVMIVLSWNVESIAAQHDGGRILVGAGPGTPDTIREAVQMAGDGDRIVVFEGVYNEWDIVIDKQISMEGVDAPVIDGNGEGYIFIVKADSVSISGFDLRNTGRSHIREYAAVMMDGVTGGRVEGNRITNTFFGIYVADSKGMRIAGNEISSNNRREMTSGNGIHLWKTTGSTIRDNRVSGHRDGIYLEFGSELTVTGNISRDNNRYGLHFMFSDNCEYSENHFQSNGAGVAVMYSEQVNMHDNRFEQNWGASSYGLLLKDMRNSTISGNTFYRNTVAIYTEGSNRMDIVRNHFELNGWAIRLKGSSRDNLFGENNFIENSFDVGTESRQNPNRFEGNYWSHYEGYDLDRDGVGDIPYRPVRLFSVIIGQEPHSLILLRSLFVSLLDAAERMMPVLTPATLTDEQPRMERIQ